MAITTIILVHGAWHGAWCWRHVLPLLRSGGGEAHAVTLTGLGDRAHLAHAGINLDTREVTLSAPTAASTMAETAGILVAIAAPISDARRCSGGGQDRATSPIVVMTTPIQAMLLIRS